MEKQELKLNKDTSIARDYPLESYEWDKMWLDLPEKKEAKRVFYVGDSISVGTQKKLTTLLGDGVCVDNYATSKGLDNPFFLKTLELVSQQLPAVSAVVFNNGLHGKHLSAERFEELYEDAALRVREIFKDVPVFLLLCTDTDEERRHLLVLERNAAIRRIAEKHGFDVIDVFTTSEKIKHTRTDRVHYTDEGYEELAKAILPHVKNSLGI